MWRFWTLREDMQAWHGWRRWWNCYKEGEKVIFSFNYFLLSVLSIIHYYLLKNCMYRKRTECAGDDAGPSKGKKKKTAKKKTPKNKKNPWRRSKRRMQLLLQQRLSGTWRACFLMVHFKLFCDLSFAFCNIMALNCEGRCLLLHWTVCDLDACDGTELRTRGLWWPIFVDACDVI